MTDKTAMVIVNSPHNPTGSVFSRAALEGLRDICVEHDLLVLSDEVYEDLTFDDAEHVEVLRIMRLGGRPAGPLPTQTSSMASSRQSSS